MNGNEDENSSDNSQMTSSTQSNLSEKSKQVTNKVKSIGKEALKGKGSMLAPIVHILWWVVPIVVFLIILLGIIMFFLTIPGATMEKLKEYAKSIGQNIASWFGVDSTTQVDDLKIYETLDYLEEMGYDLKGYGFLTDFMTTNDVKDYDTQYLDSQTGVIRNTDDDTIANAESEFIYTYLVSDNYVYTLKNDNTSNILSNANNWLANLAGGITAVGQHLFDFITNGALSQYWTRGLIGIYYDTGTLGKKGTYYQNGIFSLNDISIDVENKELTIKRKSFFGDTISYNLDGWTGRYGMPLEFLLSIHIATMMPDLAYDMATSFETEITLLLHNTENYTVDYENEETGETEEKEVRAYVPYIAYVTDHWYRDVYFVTTDDTDEFIVYDYEYESIMKERWTLYEQDTETGEYILYVYSDENNGEWATSSSDIDSYKSSKIESYNGLYRYTGTTTEAESEGVTVGKKAETTTIAEAMEDLEWNQVGNVISAYKLENGTINQTGEGLRTETNEEIKKMFLTNKYFTYDGTTERAETIRKMRDVVSNEYGALSDSDLEKTVTTDEGEEALVSDYSSTVSLSQESLTAFSILENTHTLDADYIYRDFKELIVELGYFEKEELTDESPTILAWLIPEINSNGFPKRELDKNENEFGTMAHSRNDYISYNNPLDQVIEDEGGSESSTDEQNGIEVTDEEVLEEAKALEAENIVSADSEEIIAITTNENDVDIATATSGTKRGYLTSLDTEATLEGTATANTSDSVSGSSSFEVSSDFDDAGWDESKSIVESWATKLNINTIGNYYTKGNEASYLSFMKSLGGIFAEYAGEDNDGTGDSASLMGAQEFVYSTMWLMGFDYCAYCGGSNYDWGRCTALLGTRSNNPYTAYPTGHGTQRCIRLIDKTMISQVFTTNCNFTVDKVMYKAGLMGGDDQPSSSCNYKDLVNKYDGEIVFEISDLHFGDIIECFSSNGNNSTDPNDWSGWYHVMYVGEETEDTIVIYQTGHDFTNDGNWRYEISKTADRSEMPAKSGWVGIHLWDLEYNGAGSYKGYEGNEAVVSPVTGVLLQYGTYTEEDIDSLSEEAYRVNTDLKYNSEESEIVSDKVGYAKILVLDAENYLKLEKAIETEWTTDSLYNLSSQTYGNDLANTDELEEYNSQEKTVYGYKEFAELYNEYGIEGYEIYIDGFALELPGEEDENGIVTTEQELSREYFIENALTVSSSNDFESELESLYEKDDEYKTGSEKITARLNAEIEVKDEASPAVYLGDSDILLIKEGTVIGRTYTDEEIYKLREENPDTDFTTKYTIDDGGVVRDEEDTRIVQGNYIRIIMTDTDDAIVENVEDYMKLDTGETEDDSVVADDVITFMAGVLTAECGPTSEEGLAAAAWVIKNRLDSGKFGATLEEILVAPNQFVVVATDPSECTGGYVTQGETISLEVNGTTYYVNAPSDLAIEIAASVISGSTEYENKIADRCYWKSASTNVDASKDPIQIPAGTGNKYHY